MSIVYVIAEFEHYQGESVIGVAHSISHARFVARDFYLPWDEKRAKNVTSMEFEFDESHNYDEH